MVGIECHLHANKDGEDEKKGKVDLKWVLFDMTHKDGVNLTGVFGGVFVLDFLHEMRLMRCYKAALITKIYPISPHKVVKQDDKRTSEILTCEAW